MLAIFIIAACAYSTGAAADFNEVKAGYQPTDVQLLSREGEPLHRLRQDTSVRRGQWLALADVSPALRTALVLSEDKRFQEHRGIDALNRSLAGKAPHGLDNRYATTAAALVRAPNAKPT